MIVELHNDELSFYFNYKSHLCWNVFENNNIFWSCNIVNFVIFLVVTYKNCFFVELRKRLIASLLTLF